MSQGGRVRRVIHWLDYSALHSKKLWSKVSKVIKSKMADGDHVQVQLDTEDEKEFPGQEGILQQEKGGSKAVLQSEGDNTTLLQSDDHVNGTEMPLTDMSDNPLGIDWSNIGCWTDERLQQEFDKMSKQDLAELTDMQFAEFKMIKEALLTRQIREDRRQACMLEMEMIEEGFKAECAHENLQVQKMKLGLDQMTKTKDKLHDHAQKLVEAKRATIPFVAEEIETEVDESLLTPPCLKKLYRVNEQINAELEQTQEELGCFNQ